MSFHASSSNVYVMKNQIIFYKDPESDGAQFSYITDMFITCLLFASYA